MGITTSAIAKAISYRSAHLFHKHRMLTYTYSTLIYRFH